MLAVFGTGAGLIVWAHSYGAPGPGELGGTVSPALKPITDGVNDTYLIDTGRTGSAAWVSFSLENDGDHEVTIERDALLSIGVTGVRWAPIHISHGSIEGPPTAASARPLPARIGDGSQEIMVFLLLRRPSCAPTEEASVQGVQLTWSALAVHHNLNVTFGQDGNGLLPILVCYPKAALSHIDKSGGFLG